MKALNQEISEVLNKHSRENMSNTPDFILAGYLMSCLAAFEKASNLRAAWYSPEGITADSEVVNADAAKEPTP